MDTDVKDKWLQDALGVDPQAYAAPGAGDTAPDAAAAPADPAGVAAPGGEAQGAAAAGAQPDNAPAGDAQAGDAQSGDAQAGDAQPKTAAKATFTMISNSCPTVTPPADEAPAGATEDAAPGGEGGGDAKAEDLGKVIDKVVEIGEKVVKALADHSKITNSDKTLSVLPENVKPNEVRDGALGKAAFNLSLVGGFGNSLADLVLEIDYMVCTVFGKKGIYLKDIRLNVSGSVFPGLVVDIQAAYGSPGNTGPSAAEWIVDLTVDINAHWNSIYLFDGKESYKLRLNAAKGASVV